MNRYQSHTPQEPNFIVIEYGDNEKALLNPQCSTQTFVQWIRRICHCDNDIILDLVGMDGQIKNLPMTSDDYASDYVTGRETYVLIRVEKEGENGSNRYISLLNHLDNLHPDLFVKLNELSRPDKSGKRNKKTSIVRGRKSVAR